MGDLTDRMNEKMDADLAQGHGGSAPAAAPKPKPQPGWYWVQDMRGAARPAWYNGSVYYDSPSAAEPISFHWPSFRRLGRCTEPSEQQIKAAGA